MLLRYDLSPYSAAYSAAQKHASNSALTYKEGGFQILLYLTIRARRKRKLLDRCPSCAEHGRDQAGDNLAISIGDPRFLNCWAGSTREMTRAVLGQPVPKGSYR